MSIREILYGAMTKYLRGRGYDCVEVLTYEEYLWSSGYCETCYEEETRVRFDYRDSNGKTRTAEYYGPFGKFIAELTATDDDA